MRKNEILKDMDNAISLKDFNELKSILLDIKDMVLKLVDETSQELLTPKEVCKILKIGRSTYQRYIDAGIFTQIHIGNNNSRAYVKRLEIERLMNEGKI